MKTFCLISLFIYEYYDVIRYFLFLILSQESSYSLIILTHIIEHELDIIHNFLPLTHSHFGSKIIYVKHSIIHLTYCTQSLQFPILYQFFLCWSIETDPGPLNTIIRRPPITDSVWGEKINLGWEHFQVL